MFGLLMIVNWNLFDIWILDFVILSGKARRAPT